MAPGHHTANHTPRWLGVMRLLLIGIGMSAMVTLIHGLILQHNLPPQVKAATKGKAACSAFTHWLVPGTDHEQAASALRTATRDAQTAAELAPEAWAELVTNLRAVEHKPGSMMPPDPILAANRNIAINGAITKCGPLVREDLEQYAPDVYGGRAQ